MSKRICVFGASVTSGYWDEEMGGWANRLRLSIVNSVDRKYSVYNLGISGDTTEDLLKRLRNECEARHPSIVIIGIGSNDSSCRDKFKKYFISPDNFLENLKKLKKIVNLFTKKFIFIGLTAVDESKTIPAPFGRKLFYRNENIEKYNKIIKKFCEENDLPFIEMYDLLDKEDLEDGLHPNSAGHEKIFQRVKDYLLENKII